MRETVVYAVAKRSQDRGSVTPGAAAPVLSSRPLLESAALVGGGMLLGRLTGFVRDASLVGVLGVTRDTDLAIFTLTIPDLLTALLLGGAAGAVLIPELQRLKRQESALAATQLAIQAFIIVGFASAVLAVVFAVAASWVVQVLAPGFATENLDQAVHLLRIALIGFPLAAVTMVSTAALQARERFGMPALGTPLYNAILLASIWGFLSPGRLSVLAWAVVAAAALRLLSQLSWGTKYFEGSLRGVARLSRWHGALTRRYAEALGALGLTFLNPVVARAIASTTPGDTTAVYLAHRLVDLVMGLCVAVLNTLLFPRLSAAFLENDRGRAQHLARRATVILLWITVPSTAYLLVCAGPVVAILFQHGRVAGAETDYLASLIRLALLSLPASSLIIFLTSLFHAQRETRTPLRIGILTTSLHLGAAWLGYRQWGAAGLLTAGTLLAWLQAALLSLKLRRCHGLKLWSRTVVQEIAMLAGLAVLAGAAMWSVAGLTQSSFVKLLGGAVVTLLVVGVPLFFRLRRQTNPHGFRG
jgi:putative peptidoglycan lipid II flippase